MTKLEAGSNADVPAAFQPDAPADLIPEVRQHTRRRRWRNFAIALVALALVACVVAIVGSGTPSKPSAGGGTSSPSSSVSSNADRAVVPKEPTALAVGPSGDLYLADGGRNEILRRLPTGKFEVVAGTGVAGDTGDRGPAVHAEIANPDGLAVAPDGAVYFVESNSTIREISPSGTITTVVGANGNCAGVSANSHSIPAQDANLDVPSLSIGANGLLVIATTPVCPHTQLGGFLQLTSSGTLVQLPTDPAPLRSGFCGYGAIGAGVTVFSCMSGGGQGPRLMLVKSSGMVTNYPDHGSQPGLLATANGTVYGLHNRAVVGITLDGLHTLATSQQIAKHIGEGAGAIGDGGIAADSAGDVFFDQDFLIARRGCTDVLLELTPKGIIQTLWRSPIVRSCY